MTANRFTFRVWDKENKKMVYPDGNGYFQLEYDTVITGNGELFNLVNQETVNNCILMESTGLVDKNGKEMFEGDVLKDKNELIVVQYNTKFNLKTINLIEKLKEITIEDNSDDLGMINFNFFICKDYIENEIEIIGNIFENPELLKEVN